MAAFSLGPLSCGDLEKYQKPAAKSPPEPITKSVDLKGTPEERRLGREFADRLEAVRTTFYVSNDTIAALSALSTLLTDVNNQRKSMAEEAEFRAFYLLMIADILNQVSDLKRRIGDIEGAREAQRVLSEIRPQLPQ
jgi:hypothetical protein